MKKIYVLLFSCIWIIGFSQDYYSLLSGTVWKIQKIQWDNQTVYYPPEPFSNSGSGGFDKVGDTYVFNTKFFNSVGGTMVYGENNANYFTILSTSMTLGVYEGENAELVKDFDFLIYYFTQNIKMVIIILIFQKIILEDILLYLIPPVKKLYITPQV